MVGSQFDSFQIAFIAPDGQTNTKGRLGNLDDGIALDHSRLAYVVVSIDWVICSLEIVRHPSERVVSTRWIPFMSLTEGPDNVWNLLFHLPMTEFVPTRYRVPCAPKHKLTDSIVLCKAFGNTHAKSPEHNRD